MTSEDSTLQLMEKLSEWSEHEIQKNLDGILPRLIYSSLSEDDKGQVMQSVHALLVTCLPCVPLKGADNCLLRHVMPAAQQLFNESLRGIQLRLEEVNLSQTDDVNDTLASLLQVCMEILKCVDAVLHYIASQGSVTAGDVPSVPKTVALLLLQTFQHCKESERLYGNAFSSVAEVLGAVFRQCHQVQCHFFSVITTNIHFSCTLEDDISMLTEVLQILSQIGEQLMGLDLKTMAEQWKGFARLIQQYLAPLRQRFDVAQTVQFLCLEVEHGLEQIINMPAPVDTRALARALKTTTFVLKIVVKLCEQFGGGGGYLGECYSHLLHLLFILYRHSPPSLKLMCYADSLIEDIERHIIVAADPLLSHLIAEEGFRVEYFKHCTECHSTQDDHLLWLLLSLATMKKLATTNVDQRALWLMPDRDENIVGCLLTYLKNCHRALSEDVSVPAIVRSGEPPRNGTLYEALVSSLAGLLLCSTESQFSVLESFLLDCLVEPSFWPAILANDVWCICARAGTSELCQEQVFYLSELVFTMDSSGVTGHPGRSNIALLLGRLCAFLGNRGKQALIERYPPSTHPHMWKIFGLHFLPESMQDSISATITGHAVSCIEKYLRSPHSVEDFNGMVQGLSGLSSVLDLNPPSSSAGNEYSALVTSIFSLWQHITTNEAMLSYILCAEECRVSGCSWLPHMICDLCACSQYLVHLMNNQQILLVLTKLQAFLSLSASSVKIAAMKVLHGLGKRFLDPSPEQSKICTHIASTFATLLQDSNPLVRQFALQTFEYFAHVTRHESIVADTVIGNENLQQLVTEYLQKDAPLPKPGCVSLKEYLIKQSEATYHHKCKEGKPRPILNDAPSPQEVSKPAKKMRLDLDDSDVFGDLLGDDLLNCLEEKGVSEAVARISKDTEFLVTYCALNSLPATAKSDLQKVVGDLSKLVTI